jgi:sugar transferase (PEP-CTERM system associated)
VRPLHLPSTVTTKLAEFALLLACFVAAVFLRFGSLSDYPALLSRALANTIVIQVCLSYVDLYEGFSYRSRLDDALRVAQSLVIALVVLTLLYWAAPSLEVGRGVVFIQMSLTLPTVVAWRLARRHAAATALGEGVLILGTGTSAQQVARELVERPGLGLRVVGFLGEDASQVGRHIVNPAVVGTLGDLSALTAHHRVSVIVVALDDARGRMPVAELLRHRMAGVYVLDATTLLENLTGRIMLRDLRPSWLVFAGGFDRRGLYQSTKRSLELALALVFFALNLPVFLAVALLVKLTSAGPVLFAQERVGERGRRFLVYKFRTMRADAEAASGPVWAARDGDPRATRLGRLLRKVRLDELPQLINVIKGDMSLVGPRPERPHFVEMLRAIIPFYEERHSVKPGITGWAQVKFGYGSNLEDAEEKLEYDLYYIKHMSWAFDIGILLYTLKVVLTGRGAR